ncbi:tRNA dihydrouridine synthase DusB [bacterium]|nr:tRNA dihydrouridine synthase DusB [bacterium]
MNTQNTLNKELNNQNKIKIKNIEINSKVISAPMAGITDYVLRKLIRKYSKNCLLTTEMISSEALVQQKECHIIHSDNEEYPISFQISGHKPDLIAKSAEILKEKGATIIDINMGCPVNKVMKATDGCALMKSPNIAADIIKAVKDKVDLPVTCKFRLGINQETINFVDFAVKMQEAGADAICVHARTRVQMYSGNADWKRVSKLRGEIDIPYFINGDIISEETAKKALEESQANGIAIGRGLLGNPWLPAQIDNFLKTGIKSQPKTLQERINILKEHLDNEIAFRGEMNGIKFFRKFYPYYIKGIKGASEYRGKLVTEENYNIIIDILENIKNQNE